MRFRRAAVGALSVAALVSGSLAIGMTTASADAVDQVTICHRTNANTNPYVVNSPDVAGVLDGHAGHTGPVWDPTLKAQHVKWGDIIPPFEYDGGSFPGMNWDATGQAIYDNGCVPPGPPPVQQYGSLALQKVVLGLPLAGEPVDGAIPSSFTAHVSCDDGTEQDVTFPGDGGAGTPAQIDGIEAGSTCTVVEQGTDGFPTGTVVGYDPSTASTAGVSVEECETTQVTITNDFRNVELKDAVVTPTDPVDPVDPVVAPATAVAPAVAAAPTAIVATPAFTG
jgi:hypothetical protein